MANKLQDTVTWLMDIIHFSSDNLNKMRVSGLGEQYDSKFL